jgi:mono/diheme cytochrome c family protein
MRKFLKWVGIVLGGLVGLVIVAVVVVYVVAEVKINRTYEIAAMNIPVPTDAAAIARGQHLVQAVFLCSQCHLPDMSGGVLFDDPLTGRLAPSNLTGGRGGVAASYSDEDWARAIRHGVLKDQKAGVAMLSNVFYTMSDADLGAMIAYLKSLPPVDKEFAPTSIGLLGRVFILLEEKSILPAVAIDHAAPHPSSPPIGVTAEYGHYLAGVCTMCHGENYAGFTGEGSAPNLTPAGDLGRWSLDDFRRTLRTGLTPDGKELNPDNMPWKFVGQMTDSELEAMWLFLHSLPPAESASPPGS